MLLSVTPAICSDPLSFDLRDADGVRHTAAELAGHKAAVFAFIATDCPISNGYAPELARLFADYSRRGVAFYAVHSDPSISAEDLKKHVHDFGYPFPTLLDPAQGLARQIGATTTPEAAVASPAGALLYRGRIDDRNLDFGKVRQRALRPDLRLALDEILAGKPVSQPVTKAIGCAIPFAPASRETKITFTRDIAPILYKHCVTCHRPGEVAPFPLLTYRDAGKRASLIAAVTTSRYMPPWQPEPGYGNFQDERRLAPAEITTIRQWAEAGALEGDPAELPPPPHFTEGWQLGRPDRVVRMPKPFPVSADGPDLYQCFVIPLEIRSDQYVQALEFRAGNRGVVHHALFFLDNTGVARSREPARPGEGYPCFGTPGFLPSGALGGWTPGGFPIRWPERIPAVLKKNSDLVMQIHYHPTGKPEMDQSSLGFYFTGASPQKRIMDIPLGSRAIDIPPGERAYKVRDHFTVPIDVEAIGIIPHAHYICKDMKGWAILPDGRMEWLLWIRDWNFNWQEQYRYAHPLKLPAGTRLEMEFTYDNSADNPRNPNHPPKQVTWGPGTTDEMAGLHVQVVPERMSEISELGQALWGKMMRAVGGGFYRLPAEKR